MCAAQCGLADLDNADLRLNITNVEEVRRRSAPYGIPQGPKDRQSANVLYSRDHILGYSSETNSTLWAAFPWNTGVRYRSFYVDFTHIAPLGNLFFSVRRLMPVPS